MNNLFLASFFTNVSKLFLEFTGNNCIGKIDLYSINDKQAIIVKNNKMEIIGI